MAILHKKSVSQLEISDTALILISPQAHKMLTTSTAAPNFYAPQLQTPDISSTA